jgi:Reverse transcriptase (RNA-dependent DNA polymerase)
VADTNLLDDLRDRLLREIYEPSHACKVLLPKRSGILRPYTILTVEDQVVYQALANVVAERLAPIVRRQYLTVIFGHMYAGKSSTWFYKPWRRGYSAFNKAARDSFKRGLKFTASFDLTACYDSLDYEVLCHFLKKLQCDQEFCDKLRFCLGKWAATNTRIYHSHGIPQGPLCSGLLSEVVLRHFDVNYGTRTNVRYLRYVDDIRLFAAREDVLRRMLVRLDTLSKDIGLFPQAAKINIHRIQNIDEELKLISAPYFEEERDDEDGLLDQERLRRDIKRQTVRSLVKDDTKFKHLLGQADPTSKLNHRLLRISLVRPDLIPNIMRYFRRYERLPITVTRDLLDRLKREPLYESTTAEIVTTLDQRTPSSHVAIFRRILRKQWKPRAAGIVLKAALGRPLFREAYLNETRVRYGLRAVQEWWPRAELFSVLNENSFGTHFLKSVLNLGIRDQVDDVALSAANRLATIGLNVERPLKSLNRAAAMSLRQLGVISRLPRGVDGVERTLKALVGRTTGVNWRVVFGKDYKQAEKQAVFCRALADTNATAFVNAADVFNDLLLSRLYRHDPTLGTYTLGKVGSILSSKRLRRHYPSVLKLVSDIHEQRYISNLSHAKARRTGKPTGRIKFRYRQRAKTLMRSAFAELAANW